MIRCNAPISVCRVCGFDFRHDADAPHCLVCGADRGCRRKVDNEGERCDIHDPDKSDQRRRRRAKHGQRTKYIPAEIASDYAAAMDDPELTSLRRNIATAESRVNQLLRRLDTGESPDVWDSLKRRWQEFRDLNKLAAELKEKADAVAETDDPNKDEKFRGFMDKMAEAKQESARKVMAIGKLIEKGGDADTTWELIHSVEDRMSNYQRSEHRRIVELRQIMTMEQATFMAMEFVAIVQKHCDPDTSRLVGDAVCGYLMGGTNSRSTVIEVE